MPTTTTNYSFQKPVVGADEDAWGGYINSNFDSLDSLLSGTTALTSLDITGDFTVDTNTLHVDSTNNRVGVGTGTPSADLHISSSAGSLRLEDADVGYYGGLIQSGGALFIDADLGGTAGVAGNMRFRVAGGTEAMRIDASGNVGVGTTSPTQKIEIEDATYPRMAFTKTGVRRWSVGGDGTDLTFKDESLSLERMRIDASGNLLMGTTTGASLGTVNEGILIRADGGNDYYIQVANNGTATYGVAYFYNGNGLVGSIQTVNSSTQYNTSSDYRLKEDIQPMTGASDRVLSLKPCNFAWKVDGVRVDGFLAHEVQEIVPEAISGVKDGMRTEEYEVSPVVYEDVIIPAVLDADGNEVEPERTEQRLVSDAVMGTREVPDYQGIDQSKLVPLLTAALQETLGEIESLKARLDAIGA